jgi:hypothetical protein
MPTYLFEKPFQCTGLNMDEPETHGHILKNQGNMDTIKHMDTIIKKREEADGLQLPLGFTQGPSSLNCTNSSILLRSCLGSSATSFQKSAGCQGVVM